MRRGITPAHAGKSLLRLGTGGGNKDHPRTRGEKRIEEARRIADRGSPPHTRGKAWGAASLRTEFRITPAHAGKSASSRATGGAITDHPRTRGEKFLIIADTQGSTGSPPHTRGKATITSARRFIIRITPAHAGKSAKLSITRDERRDHPRTRGEKFLLRRYKIAKLGSPPHTRGKVLNIIE